MPDPRPHSVLACCTARAHREAVATNPTIRSGAGGVSGVGITSHSSRVSISNMGICPLRQRAAAPVKTTTGATRTPSTSATGKVTPGQPAAVTAASASAAVTIPEAGMAGCTTVDAPRRRIGARPLGDMWREPGALLPISRTVAPHRATTQERATNPLAPFFCLRFCDV